MRMPFIFAFMLLPLSLLQAQLDEKDIFQTLEKQHAEMADTGKAEINNFDHWAYSQKKHALVFYLAPMYQAGFNSSKMAKQFHQDAGAMYRWHMVDTDKTAINFQGWIEQSSLISGRYTKAFMQELGIHSAHNGSDTENFHVGIESFFFEGFFLNKKWDITLGRFDPLFLTTFTDYSGWDKYNYFSKSAASDPVPTLESGMGIYTEYHFSDYFSLGALVSDDQPRNDFLYLPNFRTTSYAYMVFSHFSFPSIRELVSMHKVSFYYVEANANDPQGRGVIYTGNQGITDKWILVMKLSNGSGRINKLNGAYVLGITRKKPFMRNGDQWGIAAIINEKSSNFEYGLDTYYKFHVKRWLNLSLNFQMYYGINDRMNYIPGIRAFISY